MTPDTVNPYQLFTQLDTALQLARKDDFRGACAHLDGIAPNLFLDDQIKQTIGMAYDELKNGSVVEGVNALENVAAEMRQTLPRFRIVLIDTTDVWNGRARVEESEKLWAAYLYDENRKVHTADRPPSYAMNYLYTCSANADMSETTTGTLIGETGGTTMYCSTVDALDWRFKLFCGIPSHPNAEDYKALEESEVQYYKANVCLDVPRRPPPDMLISVAREQFLAGEHPEAINTLKLVTGGSMLTEIRDLISQIHHTPHEIDGQDAFAELLTGKQPTPDDSNEPAPT